MTLTWFFFPREMIIIHDTYTGMHLILYLAFDHNNNIEYYQLLPAGIRYYNTIILHAERVAPRKLYII